MMHKKMSAAQRFQSLLWPLACLYDLVMSLNISCACFPRITVWRS